MRGALDDLAETLQTVRALRLGATSSAEQAYSTALIRREVDALRDILRLPDPVPASSLS